MPIIFKPQHFVPMNFNDFTGVFFLHFSALNEKSVKLNFFHNKYECYIWSFSTFKWTTTKLFVVPRYPDTLGVSDVFAALQSLPTADFLTNKFLGRPEGLPSLAMDRWPPDNIQWPSEQMTSWWHTMTFGTDDRLMTYNDLRMTYNDRLRTYNDLRMTYNDLRMKYRWPLHDLQMTIGWYELQLATTLKPFLWGH